jgi:hypothetical protein
MSFGGLLDTAMGGSLRRTVDAVVPAFEHLPPEGRLLRGASYEGLRRLAGRPVDPVEGVVLFEPCPPDVLRVISAAAGARLLEILGNRHELVSEWLGLAAGRKLRISHDCVPDLLEHARTRPEIHELVMQVGGERLTWLAHLNPAWMFARRTDPEEQLGLGTPVERARALRRIRQEDPARGRELLQAILTGRSERTEARVALLDALRVGLSAEDEALMEGALRDPRKELREHAQGLIRRIPGSRFGQRFAARARQLVSVQVGALGTRIEIREPDGEADPAWIDDGLDPRPPKGIGATAWILQQTMAFAPPSIWSGATLEAFQRSEWSQPLLNGLAQAAAAYADAEWCEALLLARAGAPKDRENLPPNAKALLGVLTRERAENVLLRLLDDGAPWVPALAASATSQWSERFSRLIVERLPELLEKWQYGAAGSFLQAASLRLDPTVLPAAERLRDLDIHPAWARPSVLRLLRTLELRLSMREELEAA